MSIVQNRAEVENDDAQKTGQLKIFSDTKAGADNAARQKPAVTTNRFDADKLLLAKELKEAISFRALLEADGHQIQHSGNYSKCCCPFHPDRTPSFFVYQEDNYAKCNGCDWYGDVFKYESEFHRVDFKQAWLRLNDFVRNHPRAGRKAKPVIKKVTLDEPQFTPKQLAERRQYAERLATESWLADMICLKRLKRTGEKWNPNVIRHLAKEGSLGWADCLAFIYPTGTKYRNWPDKELKWEGATSLWRGQLLAAAEQVYLTESETDVIAMLHSDLEKVVGNLVMAAPSATTFKKEWAPQFQGKSVIFCYDNDRAGEKGTRDVAVLLAPFAKELLTVDLKEVA